MVPADEENEPLRARGHLLSALNHSLLGDGEKALSHMEKAVENGFTQLAVLQTSPDLETLRKATGYKGLEEKVRGRMEKDRRRQLEAYRRLDFSLTAIDGKPVRRSDFAGQVLIVDFWGTWCPPCRAEIPHFIELYRRHAARGLRIIGLNWENGNPNSDGIVKNYVAKAGIPYPCALATREILQSVGVSSFPTTIIFGRDGTPRAVEVGARDLEYLERIVKPLLDEPAPAADPKKEAEPARK